ncbi:MAG: DUF4367 domain-containing protein [Clostridia bacterium]|nr:DUF4367 domain-containing protein [Clostridia bacterium]
MNEAVKNELRFDALLSVSSAALAEANSQYLHSFDSSETAVPKHADKRARKTLNSEVRKSNFPAFYKFMRSAAAILLIFCIAALTLCVSIEAIRTEIWEAIVSFFDEYLTVGYKPSAIEPPPILLEYREPTLQPAGTTKVVSVKNPVMYLIEYQTPEGNSLITFAQFVLVESPGYYDNDCIVSEIKINEFNAQLMEYNDNSGLHYSILWTDYEYQYELHCYSDRMTAEELISIAQTVK